jgi:hypothetical protein
MKQSILKVSILILSVGIFSSGIIAQTTSDINVVTTAVPFLRISPDARAGGMGDVGIATPPDAGSSFWNLSKTTFNTKDAELGLTYTPWLKDLGLTDVYLIGFSGYYKLGEEQAIASSIRYFSLGNIQFTDYAGNPLQQNRPREFSIDFGYTRKMNNKLALGVALRYINSSLANGSIGGVSYKAGNAIAGDISLYHSGLNEKGEGLGWGIVLSNLGSKISYTNDAANKDYIPANLGLGIGYTTIFDETSKLSFGLDVNKLMVPVPPTPVDPSDPNADAKNAALLQEYRSMGVLKSWFKSFGDSGGFGNELKEFQVSIGAEYTYNDQFALRAGYFYEDKTKGNRKYFTVGAGLKYNIIGINFSYLIPSGSGVTRNPLSNTLRFGVTFDLIDNK